MEAIIYVYDTTHKASLDALRDRWGPEAHAHIVPRAVRVLVGMKRDLEAKREVTLEEAEDLAVELGVTASDGIVLEINACDLGEVDALFARIIGEMYQRRRLCKVTACPCALKREFFESSSSEEGEDGEGGGEGGSGGGSTRSKRDGKRSPMGKTGKKKKKKKKGSPRKEAALPADISAEGES